jgi:hypothetical protein
LFQVEHNDMSIVAFTFVVDRESAVLTAFFSATLNLTPRVCAVLLPLPNATVGLKNRVAEDTLDIPCIERVPEVLDQRNFT